VRRRRYVKLRSRLGSLAHAQVELVELSGVIGDVGLGCRSSLQTSIRPGKDEPHRRNACCVVDPHKGEAVGPHNPWVMAGSARRLNLRSASDAQGAYRGVFDMRPSGLCAAALSV